MINPASTRIGDVNTTHQTGRNRANTEFDEAFVILLEEESRDRQPMQAQQGPAGRAPEFEPGHAAPGRGQLTHLQPGVACRLPCADLLEHIAES